MNLRYCSLHNHSSFSIYDGLGFPKDHFDYVISQGGDSLAITDHGSMNGLGYSVTAYNALAKKGIKFRAIYGVEAYVLPSIENWHRLHTERDTDNELVVEDESESKNYSKWYDPLKRRHHLVITALNNTGLQNLFTLVSLSYRRENFYRFPRMDFEMLRKYNDGLAISTACIAGMPAWLSLKNRNASESEITNLYDGELLPLLEIFGRDRAFLELQFNALEEQNVTNNHLIKYANHSGYKLIVASDAHYCRPELWREREIYKSLGYQMKNGKIDPEVIPKQIEDLKCELYPHSADQIYSAYEKYYKKDQSTDQIIKDAINRTHDIAWQLMGQVSPDSTIKLPIYASLNHETPFNKLKRLCVERLKEIGKDHDPKYIERTIYELQIIKDKNISEYFLTKKSILDTLRKDLLLGTGRGSGAGSIVNYLLEITLADPIKGDLLFERFISPSRAELPDIDSDCEDKDKAYELLKSEFGEDNVLAISNYNTLKLKSLVKDISKLYGVAFEEVNECTKVMESEAKSDIMAGIGQDQKLYELTYENSYKYSPTFNTFINKYPKVGECLSVLYKSIKSIGRHAGGVLIVPDAHKHLPIIRVRDVLQSPFTEGMTAQHLKLFGLIKFDVLGLTTLKIIRRCIELILKSQSINPTTKDVWDFYNNKLHPDVIDPADKKVFKKVYHDGNFPSIFQFAERGVQDFCKRAKPNNVVDIAAVTALFRPGPLCLSGDTSIVTSRNLWKNLETKRKTVKDLYELFISSKKEISIVSIDEASRTRVTNKIIGVFKSKIKPVYKITVELPKYYHDSSTYCSDEPGYTCKASLDHPFYTKKGWKELKDITEDDYILFLKKKPGHNSDSKKYALSSGSVSGKKYFRSIAKAHYEYRCVFCSWNSGSLDVNHITGSRFTDNSPGNLNHFCPNHHRMYSEGKFSKEEIIAAREPLKFPSCSEDFYFVRFRKKEYAGEEQTYDISVESPNHNFIAGRFVAHNCGKADVKYLDALKETPTYEHSILENVLGETKGQLIFQEQFMQLAHKLAGFTLDEADKLRKLLVKPSQELGEEMKAQRIEAGNKFIHGCIQKGLTKKRAQDLWHKEILGFISYGFNKSHAYVYAYNSYQCAWLYTYYEKEWIKSCLECDPDLERTIATVSGLGYTVSKPDINESLADQWQILDKKCVPPLAAIKGIGDIAAEELVNERKNKFTSLNDFLFRQNDDELQEWRYSKFNKKSLEALVKLEAFDSILGPDIGNHKKLFNLIFDNYAAVKKGIVRTGRGKKAVVTNFNFSDLDSYKEFVPDWNNLEKIEMQKELLGTFDKKLLFTPESTEIINKFNIECYTELTEELQPHWFFVESIDEKTTSRGNPYFKLVIFDGQEKKKNVNYFNGLREHIKLNRLHVGKMHLNDTWINIQGKIHCIG